MPMPCKCCTLPKQKRADLDRRLIAGETATSLAREFNVTADSALRHKARHVSASVRAAAEAEREAGHGNNVLGELKKLTQIVQGFMAEAHRAGDRRASIDAVGKATKLLEVQARLLGQLETGPTINLTIAPQFIAVRQAVVAALTPFPEARTAVLRALEAVK